MTGSEIGTRRKRAASWRQREIHPQFTEHTSTELTSLFAQLPGRALVFAKSSGVSSVFCLMLVATSAEDTN